MLKIIRTILHDVFELAVSFKALYGVIETAGGVVLFVIGPAALMRFSNWLADYGLNDDYGVASPFDNFILNRVQHVTAGTWNFIAFYLVLHGMFNIIIVALLWRKKLWAYPAAMGFFGAFIFYQIGRFTFTHAWGLVLASVIDVLTIGLIWEEYRRIKKLIRIGG